jgi:hypothetical protein
VAIGSGLCLENRKVLKGVLANAHD